ncbi:transcriptional regulator PpsR [Granulosicoccus sp.]|nr:transcriptional regulator PpsR [Granulosicoccus sp.]
MNSFKAPAENLGTINGQTAASLLGAAADIALVIDRRGVIRDLSVSSEELATKNTQKWIGRKWADTVSIDSQEKVRELLEHDSDSESGQRQINHRTDEGENILVLYSTVVLNDKGYRVAVGKDLSSLTRMQQRLINVQQSMERDYSQLRQFETRYRLLFRTAGDAIIITEADTFKVMEANPAACTLLGSQERKLVGSNLLRWFDAKAKQNVEDALASVRMNGRNVSISLDLESMADALLVNLSLFKTNSQTHVLVRLEKKATEIDTLTQSEQTARLLALVEHAPDALVVTDPRGKVLTVNTEFLDLSQLAGAELARGQDLSSWLGQGGIDFQIIMSSLREHGSIRLYNTQMRGEFGSICDVEVSAASVSDGGLDCIGFSIRNISRRVAANDESSALAPKSIDQLTQLVGRVPLKDLVRESTELIEQLCIQSALKLTNNNRASAAEMLGLSRQSLYVKLRRYSLDDENNPAA